MICSNLEADRESDLEGYFWTFVHKRYAFIKLMFYQFMKESNHYSNFINDSCDYQFESLKVFHASSFCGNKKFEQELNWEVQNKHLFSTFITGYTLLFSPNAERIFLLFFTVNNTIYFLCDFFLFTDFL